MTGVILEKTSGGVMQSAVQSAASLLPAARLRTGRDGTGLVVVAGALLVRQWQIKQAYGGHTPLAATHGKPSEGLIVSKCSLLLFRPVVSLTSCIFYNLWV